MTIPAPRRVLLLTLPMVWFFAGVMMLGQGVGLIQLETRHPSSSLSGTMLMPLVMVLGTGLFFIVMGVFLLLWALMGREVITVTPRFLSRRRELLGLGRTSDYDVAYIRNLRVLGASRPTGQGVAGQGAIAFDYGAKSVRCASGIDEPEAATLVERIGARLPGTAG